MEVHLAGGIESSSPECHRLIEIVDGSPTLEVARNALSVMRPRKKFDTDLGVTVGSFRSGKGGQYYIGPRNLALGLAKRDEYLAKERLCYYSRHHWAEEFTIDVGFALWTPTWVHGRVEFKEPEPERWAGNWADAMFTLFVQIVSVAKPLVAYCSWRRDWRHFSRAHLDRVGLAAALEEGKPMTPGTQTILYVPPADVAALGGSERACRDAPVLDAVEIRHGDGIGIAFRLCRVPEELTTERLMAWREYLLPVLPSTVSNTNGLVDLDERPLDILPVDFDGRPI